MDTINGLALALAEIDRLLTGRCDNFELKERELWKDLDRGRAHVWYLSDGGYSRVVVGDESVWITRGISGSLPSVVEKWDHPSPELTHEIQTCERLLGQLLGGA